MAVSRFNPDYPDAGLTLLNKTTFTGVGSVSIDNVFSSTYDNYRILMKGVGSTIMSPGFRLRSGGSDNATANSYVYQRVIFDNTTSSLARGSDTKGDFASFNTTLLNSAYFDIFDPFLASATSYYSQNCSSQDGARMRFYTGTHNQTVSYDGISILASTGTMTGTIYIYGYKDEV